jgi:hypothetical protein
LRTPLDVKIDHPLRRRKGQKNGEEEVVMSRIWTKEAWFPLLVLGVGAIVGGLAVAAVANETKAKPVVVNSGTILTLELIQPLTVEAIR